MYVEKKGVGDHSETHEYGGDDVINITNITMLAIEGDYSDYELKWENDIGTTLRFFFFHGSVFTDGDAKAILFDPYGDMAIIDIATGDILDDNDDYGYSAYMEQLADSSIFGKYVVAVDVNEYYVRIWKDGTLLKTLTPDTVDDEYGGVCMSKNGKYFIVMQHDSNGQNNVLRCYEGVE